MTLRTKTGLMVAPVLAGLVAAVIAVSRFEMLSSFARMEHEQAVRNVARVRAALDQKIKRLNQECRNAAEYDAAYHFVANGDPTFVSTNIGTGKSSDPAQRALNLELYLDNAGNTVFGEGFDHLTSKELPLPTGAARELKSRFLSGKYPNGLKGVLALPGGLMMVAAHAIRTTQGTGPPRGWLVMGRWLDDANIAALGSSTLLSVAGVPVRDDHVPTSARGPWNQLQGSATTALQNLDPDTIAGYTLVRDPDGKPLLLLRVTVQRSIVAEGRRTVRYYLVSILGVGLLFGALTVFLLENNVLGPLARLSQGVLRIGIKGDPSERVRVDGDDELAELAASINRTLASLEEAQHKRRESDERFGVLLRNLHIGLIVLDPEGRAILANPAAHRMLGLADQELAGWRCTDERWQLVDENGLPLKVGDRPTCRAMSTGQPVRDALVGVFRERTKDWVWILFSVEPQLADDGSVRSVVCTMSDVTARRFAEDALRENELRTRLIIDTAMDAVVSADETGKITGWNRRAEEILGWPKDQALGQSWLELVIAPRDRGKFSEGGHRFFASGDDAPAKWRSEIAAVRRDGSEFPAELSIAPARAGGKWILSGFLRDVTERKRAEEEILKAKEAAEAASRAKSEFLANMSHEIRTPMNGIIGMTGLALEGPLNEEQREYLATVRSSADSLLAVINDILDFSKVEAGKLMLDQSDFDLRRCLDEAVKPLAIRASSKGLDWTCEVADDVPERVMGDPIRLKQIVINLVANAVKFTERGCVQLRVGLDQRGDNSVRLRFSVTDTGIGIPPEKQRAIFEAFSQADNSTSRKYGGTGLGLTISARLVEMMDGEIKLTSDAGRGAQVEFTARFGEVLGRSRDQLSASRGADDGQADDEQQTSVPTSFPLEVLVAEDNRVNQEIVRRWLEAWGYSVELVTNGREAVDRLAAKPFDLALFDVQMPIMDGVEASAAVRSRERQTGGHLPIIAVTAHAMAGDRENYLAAGMDGYVTKPMRKDELRAAIKSCLGSREAKMTACLSEIAEPGPPAVRLPEAETDPPAFDFQAALARVDGDQELLEELSALFLKHHEAELAKLHLSLETGDAEALERSAHCLNGTLGSLAAEQARREAAAVEQLAHQGRLQEAAESCRRLDTAVEGLRVSLAGRLASGKPELIRS
jgi:PAS domain S-box-containing protein